MTHVQILDCTLRDGGHLNKGVFGENTIKNTIKKLVEARVDIIEVGFLMEESYDIDTAKFHTIEEVKKVLPKDRGVSKFSLLADPLDVKMLEPYDGTIEYIRLSFKRNRFDWVLETARELMDKGYKCALNPVNCNVYTDIEFINIIEKVNLLNPWGFSIVDTFGVMRKSDLTRIYNLVEHNLNSNICVGLHLHENLGLAYSLAQHFIEISNPMRHIIIDSSLLGMGRNPGNLCTEQILDHMNFQYGSLYETAPVYDAIDEYITPLKEELTWGYSIPFALSARYGLHRTYAEYLMDKRRLRTKDIQRILSSIDREEAELFNEKYIENLYQKYLNIWIDDAENLHNLKEELYDKEILLIAPGASIRKYREKIKEFACTKKICIISINFKCDFIEPKYIFCTNIKRLEEKGLEEYSDKLIVTSNLIHDVNKYKYVMDFHNIVYCNESYCNDSTIMLLNILKQINIKKVSVAGFDGFQKNKLNHYDPFFERNRNHDNHKEKICSVLKDYFGDMEIVFLTPSLYKGDLL